MEYSARSSPKVSSSMALISYIDLLFSLFFFIKVFRNTGPKHLHVDNPTSCHQAAEKQQLEIELQN